MALGLAAPRHGQYGWLRCRSPDHLCRVVVRPDCRRYRCDRCQRRVYICSWCDRGQRYCSRHCSQAARRGKVGEAGRRYQKSPRGGRAHARRQASYRRRQRASAQKVTHQGTPGGSGSGTLVTCAITTPSHPPEISVPAAESIPSAPPLSQLSCAFCGQPCAPFVRHDFRRQRRRAGGSDDFRGAGRGDPAPLRPRGLAP